MCKRRRIGPRYSCSFDNTFPFCITSTVPSLTKLRAATLVGSIKLLQSTPGDSSPRLDNARGISLGQHVFPKARLFSKSRISFLSISSVISSTIVDVFDTLLLKVQDVAGC